MKISKQLLFSLTAITFLWQKPTLAEESSLNTSSQKVELTLQSNYAEVLDFDVLNNQARPNISFINDRISVSGHWLHYGYHNCFVALNYSCDENDIDVEDVTHEDLVSRFGTFLTNHLGIENPEQFSGALMLDMEHPVHPRKLKQYLNNDDQFSRFVHELKRRVAAAREVAPNADIGLFGVITPNLMSDSGWAEVIEAALRAGEQGLYEDLDHIVAVLYSRHGPDDGNAFNRSPRIIAQRGLELAEIIRRTPGFSRKKMYVYPLLSFFTYNGQSENNGERITAHYISETTHYIADFGIKLFGFWERGDTEAYYANAIEDTFLTYFGDSNDTADHPPPSSGGQAGHAANNRLTPRISTAIGRR